MGDGVGEMELERGDQVGGYNVCWGRGVVVVDACGGLG